MGDGSHTARWMVTLRATLPLIASKMCSLCSCCCRCLVLVHAGVLLGSATSAYLTTELVKFFPGGLSCIIECKAGVEADLSIDPYMVENPLELLLFAGLGIVTSLSGVAFQNTTKLFSASFQKYVVSALA